jgi:phosphoenolpyruvate carboxykinase (GTP)
VLKIFCVNWFRKDDHGKFVWPGYGENMRVLKWMVDRLEGKANAHSNAFGASPGYQDLNWEGMDFTPEQFQQVIGIDRAAWTQELALHRELFERLEYHLPKDLKSTLAEIERRLAA